VSREFGLRRPKSRWRDVTFCGSDFIVMAGPCSVEASARFWKPAEIVAKAGAKLLRAEL